MGIRTQKCFVVTHNPSALQSVVRTSSPVTVFEDLTTNHNKVLFTIKNYSLEILTISITTDSGMLDPIEVPRGSVDLNATVTSMQVENARKVIISSTHEFSDTSSFQFSAADTFCICCQGGQCSTGTHTFNDTIGLQAGSTKTVFQDLTTNHNKTIVKINALQWPSRDLDPDASISVTFRTAHTEEDRTITNFEPLIIQWEDLREILITSSEHNFNVTVEYEKTFCICCP